MRTWQTSRRGRIFGFDVEARPGPWQGPDFNFRHLLSMAGRHTDERTVTYQAPGFEPIDLEVFVAPLREEGVLVTGHNLVKYDLPFLNGTLMRLGLDPLPKLLVSDTFAHLPKRGQAFSASLGNMCKRFGVRQQKGSMSEYDWDLVFQGDPEALERLRKYNIGDVNAQLGLRLRLLELGLLGPPRWWYP